MKFIKYRNAAKGISAVVISICVLAAVLYSLLTLGKVIDLKFNPMYLVYIAAVAVVAILISIILAIISKAVKKHEQASLQTNLETALAKCKNKTTITRGEVQISISIENRNPLTEQSHPRIKEKKGKKQSADTSALACEEDVSTVDTEKKRGTKYSKKAIAIAIPAALVAAGVAVTAKKVSKKAKRKKSKKRF